MQHARLCIGIPLYNEARFIAATIASLIAQTDQDFQVVISDNASTDGSDRIAEECIRGRANFTLVRQQTNRGAVGNFNVLLDETDSAYFMWLGAHDQVKPDYVARAMALLAGRPDAALCFSAAERIDADDRTIKISPAGEHHTLVRQPMLRYLQSAHRTSNMSAINHIFRRSALDGTRVQPCLGSDHILLSRILSNGAALYIPEPLYRQRVLAVARSTREARLTGQEGANLGLADFIARYVADFRDRFRGSALMPPLAVVLRSVLRNRYLPQARGPIGAAIDGIARLRPRRATAPVRRA